MISDLYKKSSHFRTNSRVFRGDNWTRLSSVIDCCRHAFVSQIRGPRTTSTDLLGYTTKKSQRLLISSCPLRQSGIAVVRQIHGSTRIVGRQSAKLGAWSELLDELIRTTQPPSPLQPLRRPPSDAPTALSFVQREKSSGRIKSTLNDRPQTAVAICRYHKR